MEVATARHPKAQNCRLRYKTLRQTEGHSLLEIELLTGRYHQIRAQLSAIGNPIAGDVKYGAVPALPLDSICLHAFHLAFFHPKNSETVRIEAPLPALGAWALFA
jgi:23S rRNA pseudouridine1911/1915/1917 synthase